MEAAFAALTIPVTASPAARRPTRSAGSSIPSARASRPCGKLTTRATSSRTVRPGTTHRTTEKIPDDEPAMNLLGSVA